jgi:hypothetical protein
MPQAMNVLIDPQKATGCRLWIDGVGCWLIWFREELLIGNGAPAESSSFHWRILGDIKSQHARWVREEGRDWIDPLGAMSRGTEKMEVRTICRSHELFMLGNDVQLEYEVPSPLSRTAVLKVTSGHRSAEGIDGVILFQQTCLLGPGRQAHIPCSAWKETLLLFEREGHLWAKMHEPPGSPLPLRQGQILEGSDWRLRIESQEP